MNNNNFYYCSYCFLFLLFLIFIINFFLFLYIYFSFSLSHLNSSVYFSQLLCSALCALVFLFARTVFTSRCFGWLYFTQTQQHHRVSTEPADHGPSRNVSVTRTPECLAAFAAALFWNGVWMRDCSVWPNLNCDISRWHVQLLMYIERDFLSFHIWPQRMCCHCIERQIMVVICWRAWWNTVTSKLYTVLF